MAGPLSLGFDLGGTQVRAALVRDGQVLKRAALRTDVSGGPRAVLQQLHALTAEITQESATGKPQAIGIATPGPLDTVAGVIDHIPTLPGWDNFPLRDRLSDQFHLPAIVENDGIAAAYGEWRYGAGQGTANMVFVTVSTGIGGGVIADGRLLHGRRGMAAHIGHLRMAFDGPVCSCGGIACFEAFAAGTALGKRAKALARDDPASWLGILARREPVESRHVVQGARAGDAPCLDLLQDEARLLGLGFTSLAHIFSPERIVMGGGVSQAFDLLGETIHATIRHEAMAPFKSTPVVAAQLGDNAGLVGVATLAVMP